MKALLSNYPVAADIDDVNARADIEGEDHGAAVAAEEEIVAKGEQSFMRWWNGLSHDTRCEIIRFTAEKCYLAGYLSMAREHGYEPQGGVA